MKKALFVLGICLILVGMSTASALPLPKLRHLEAKIPNTTYPVSNNDTPPDWAKGNFTGVWGLNFLGIPLPPIGWIKGYFAHTPGWGRLEGGYAEFNVTNATNNLTGFMIWIFFLGGVTNIATGNGTYVSGIGVANETHFYWRLNAIIGPTYYIHCEYTKFET